LKKFGSKYPGGIYAELAQDIKLYEQMLIHEDRTKLK
jgi:hypothetical protein